MAHEKAKGQQAKKLFLGSLRASRAIKNGKKLYMTKMLWNMFRCRWELKIISIYVTFVLFLNGFPVKS